MLLALATNTTADRKQRRLFREAISSPSVCLGSLSVLSSLMHFLETCLLLWGQSQRRFNGLNPTTDGAAKRGLIIEEVKSLPNSDEEERWRRVLDKAEQRPFHLADYHPFHTECTHAAYSGRGLQRPHVPTCSLGREVYLDLRCRGVEHGMMGSVASASCTCLLKRRQATAIWSISYTWGYL